MPFWNRSSNDASTVVEPSSRTVHFRRALNKEDGNATLDISVDGTVRMENFDSTNVSSKTAKTDNSRQVCVSLGFVESEADLICVPRECVKVKDDLICVTRESVKAEEDYFDVPREAVETENEASIAVLPKPAESVDDISIRIPPVWSPEFLKILGCLKPDISRMPPWSFDLTKFDGKTSNEAKEPNKDNNEVPRTEDNSVVNLLNTGYETGRRMAEGSIDFFRDLFKVKNTSANPKDSPKK